MDNKQKEIAEEYQSFYEKAEQLTDKDIASYPLEKHETKRGRFERHLIGMIELFNIRYSGLSSIETRLDAFKEIANWVSIQNEYEEILAPKIEEYLNANIKGLEKRLGELNHGVFVDKGSKP